MSDEEKKAIEILGEFKKNGFHLLNLKYESRVSTTKHIENSIETVLNLIEKQSKEIEELKSRNQEINEALDEWINGERTSIFHVHKDKIKAKIEELEKEIKRKNEEDIINPFYDQIDITHIIETLKKFLEEKE